MALPCSPEAQAAAPADARLRIVAPASRPGGGLQGTVERLRSLCLSVHRAAPLRLRVDDLQGRRVLELDDVGPLVELPLPAGTYHVRSQRGTRQRAYTMVLEPGRPFTLVL